VRTFLDGRFENSAFCVLKPNGQDWLTSAGRGPEMVLGRRSSVQQMQQLAMQYPAKADLSEAIVQDFHSFRQALNVASADQRVLVLIHAPADRETALRESLRAVANDRRIIGRFHFDFEQGDVWKKQSEGSSDQHGIVLIRPGEFGMTGKVMKLLPLEATTADIITALVDANTKFVATTEKKVYSKHVAKGQSQGIYFKGAVPYGEDRDGDGQIDHGGRGPRAGAGGPPGRRPPRSR
jgi:hypothetical protein